MHHTRSRIFFSVLPFLLALTPLSASAHAQSARGIDLSYQWAQGESSRFRVQEDMTQEVSGEFSSTLQWHREFTYIERVLESDPETGSATIERTIDSVAIEVEGDAIDPARYDSADPSTHTAKSNPLIAPFASMQGQVIRFSIDPEGNVTTLTGATDLWSNALDGLSALTGSGQPGTSLKSAAPSNESMRRQIQAALKLIPSRPVKVRESWQQQLPHATPLGPLTSDLDHTLRNIQRSRSGKLARIESTGSLSAGDPTSEQDTGAMLNGLMDLLGLQVSLTNSAIEGETLFDHEQGRLIRQEFTVTTEWATSMDLPESLEGLQDLGVGGEGHQRITQRSVLERID